MEVSAQHPLFIVSTDFILIKAEPTKLKVLHLCVASLNSTFRVIKVFGYSDPLRFTRPLLLFFRSKKVVKASSLFTNSILSAASVFIIFFMTITLAASCLSFGAFPW